MRIILLLAALSSLALAPLFAPSAAASTTLGVCTPYLAFINPPPPHTCVGIAYTNINNFCVQAAIAAKCVSFVGPAL